jgi:Tol biopolymer transport system component
LKIHKILEREPEGKETIRVDGTELKRLTNGGGYTYASFSPDGSSILHRRVDGAKSQIFIMNADGTNDHNISGESTLDGWPAWSNDGKRVVFSRRVSDRFQLFAMNRDGSGVMQLTDAAGEFVNPRWVAGWNKDHVRAAPRRHESGDFSRAKIAACCQLSLICTRDLLTPYPGKGLCHLQ